MEDATKKDHQWTDANEGVEKIKKYLRDTSRSSPFGLTFSESGIGLLMKRFNVSENRLRELISLVEREAAGHGK